ncbi:6804_t:CDS:2 [Paraglomus brasilianum]|uniref:6804_t:CDS:1 n=1 Tax=Paraglomus brasilianum TaxID=144538 RepID=A0A9N9AQV2_9GLOM|nr:6804_t:CDS:2 [Paraglomus brasilianum]
MATQRAAAGVSIDEQIAAIHRSKGLTSDGDSKIGPRIPQAQDSPHQQQAHMAASQFQNLQNQHQMYGFPPVPHNQVYSPYVPSSAPFAHQLSGYITSAHPHANMAMGHHHMLQRPHMQSTHRPPQPPGMPPVMMSHVQGQSPIPASGIPGAPIPYAASMSLDKEKGRLAEEDLDPTNPAKKQKLDGNIPAGTGFMNDDNMSGHQTFFTLTIQCPNLPEKPEWNCTGQSLEIEDVSLNMLVSTLKDKIAARLSFPAGKQKLAIGGQVMKNQGALGFYNIENGTAISLQVKDRGKK